MKLNEQFWNDRYISGDIGWDVGEITAPIKTYIDQLTDKSIKILIPGAGNAYEAEHLWNTGFQNTYVLDWSEQALGNFHSRMRDFPTEQLIHSDFFTMSGAYELILEQTFFCALDPESRAAYVEKMYDLLTAGGLLVGVLFDAPMYSERPPYGGSMAEYRSLFASRFQILTLAKCYNSIPPRAGNECFIILQKP